MAGFYENRSENRDLLKIAESHSRRESQGGKVQYDQNCSACHSVDGSGNASLDAPKLADDIW